MKDYRGYIARGNISQLPTSYRYASNTKDIADLGIGQTSAINPGNSGGPLFKPKGN